MRDGCGCENLIFAGALMRTPAAVHLLQSAVDQAVHQGTGGNFECALTWEKKKNPLCSEQEEIRRTVLIKNSEGNTCNGTIQVDVGEGFHAQR